MSRKDLLALRQYWGPDNCLVPFGRTAHVAIILPLIEQRTAYYRSALDGLKSPDAGVREWALTVLERIREIEAPLAAAFGDLARALHAHMDPIPGPTNQAAIEQFGLYISTADCPALTHRIQQSEYASLLRLAQTWMPRGGGAAVHSDVVAAYDRLLSLLN